LFFNIHFFFFKKKSYAPVVEYIEAQNNSYLNQEMQADRTGMEDTRVHVCLYFIEPTGHS